MNFLVAGPLSLTFPSCPFASPPEAEKDVEGGLSASLRAPEGKEGTQRLFSLAKVRCAGNVKRKGGTCSCSLSGEGPPMKTGREGAATSSKAEERTPP